MKRIALYIVLVVYVTNQLKPFTAIINDALSHTFFKARHLATIHYENGKYHLHTELEIIAKENSDSSKNKTTSLKKTEQPQDKTCDRSFVIQEVNSFNQAFRKYFPGELPAGFLRFSSPPPKVA